MAKLKNAKREDFCQQFIIDKNATQAAIRAKYSKKTAYSQGQRLLKNVDVQKRIAELQEEQIRRVQIDADYVLNRLTEIDNLDILDILTDDLRDFRPLTDWPEAWRKSISGVDMQRLRSRDDDEDIETTISKIKWPDKTKNLEMIGKHVSVKAWDNKHEHGVDSELRGMLQEFFNLKPTTGLPSEHGE